jgi:dimethylamine/trimethylamine dehydrogenase
VTLAEASDRLVGRVDAEARLPGLGQWRRVADHREWRISQMPNVVTYLESRLDAGQVLEFGADHVAVATGSRWCASGIGRANRAAIPRADGARVLTPDDIIAGERADGPVVVLDDDHYYMGGVMAELRRSEGHEVPWSRRRRTPPTGRITRSSRGHPAQADADERGDRAAAHPGRDLAGGCHPRMRLHRARARDGVRDGRHGHDAPPFRRELPAPGNH